MALTGHTWLHSFGVWIGGMALLRSPTAYCFAAAIAVVWSAPAGAQSTVDEGPDESADESTGGTSAEEGTRLPSGSEHQANYWVAYMGQYRFRPQWSLWFDTHYNHQTFFVLRSGATHHFKEGPSLTGGYAYLLLTSGDDNRLDRQEHRAWAQAVFPWKLGKHWRFSERIRTDFRFRQAVEDGRVSDGWTFVFRPRIQTVLTYNLPPFSWGAPFLQVAEEVLVNYGDVARSAHFDQNRISGMAGIKIGGFTFRLGYMDRYVPERGASPARHEHTLLVWFNQALDFSHPIEPVPPEGTNP